MYLQHIFANDHCLFYDKQKLQLVKFQLVLKFLKTKIYLHGFNLKTFSVYGHSKIQINLWNYTCLSTKCF